MREPTLLELETAAEAYDRRLVPALFRDWAARVADAAAVHQGHRVLDVACGTGILARTAAERVGPEGRVVGLDANPGMLACAARHAPELEWREGDAGALPFEDESFDAVVSQFGLMFFPDPAAALREMHRSLARGGRLAVAVFDSLEQNPTYAAFADVLAPLVDREVTGAPFALGDEEALGELARRAELSGASVRRERTTARFPSVRDLVLADVEGWFPLAGIRFDAPTLEGLVAETEQALAPWTREDGSVQFPLSGLVLVARRPAA